MRFRQASMCAVLAFAPALLTANTVTVSTAPGATNGGGDLVGATASITTGAGIVTIDLTNTLTAAQVKNVGQNLSDLFFTLDTTTSAGSQTSSNGTFIDVGTGGAVTSASSDNPGPDFIGWGLTNSGGTYHLNGLGGAVTPENTIIGGTAGSFTAYTNANASIDNNDPHNPFVQGTGHFVLSIAGVTAATNISNVVFSFGTAAGDNVGGVPEPRFYSLLLFAGIMTAAIFYRRKSRTA